MSIMIELRNIIKHGSLISAAVTIVQTHPEKFTIEVDTAEQQIVSCSREKIDTYVAQAVAKLVSLAEEYGEKIPKESQSVWY